MYLHFMSLLFGTWLQKKVDNFLVAAEDVVILGTQIPYYRQGAVASK